MFPVAGTTTYSCMQFLPSIARTEHVSASASCAGASGTTDNGDSGGQVAESAADWRAYHRWLPGRSGRPAASDPRYSFRRPGLQSCSQAGRASPTVPRTGIFDLLHYCAPHRSVARPREKLQIPSYVPPSTGVPTGTECPAGWISGSHSDQLPLSADGATGRSCRLGMWCRRRRAIPPARPPRCDLTA